MTRFAALPILGTLLLGAPAGAADAVFTSPASIQLEEQINSRRLAPLERSERRFERAFLNGDGQVPAASAIPEERGAEEGRAPTAAHLPDLYFSEGRVHLIVRGSR